MGRHEGVVRMTETGELLGGDNDPGQSVTTLRSTF